MPMTSEIQDSVAFFSIAYSSVTHSPATLSDKEPFDAL